MFSIPNSVIVPEPVQRRLRALFAVVKATSYYRVFRRKRWSVTVAEILTRAEVIKEHVEYAEKAQLP